MQPGEPAERRRVELAEGGSRTCEKSSSFRPMDAIAAPTLGTKAKARWRF